MNENYKRVEAIFNNKSFDWDRIYKIPYVPGHAGLELMELEDAINALKSNRTRSAIEHLLDEMVDVIHCMAVEVPECNPISAFFADDNMYGFEVFSQYVAMLNHAFSLIPGLDDDLLVTWSTMKMDRYDSTIVLK